MPPHPPELLFLNGEIMPLSEGRIPVEDRGYQFADGIYEVIRVCQGKPFRLGDHLERLRRSAGGLDLRLDYDEAAMARIVAELIAQSGMRNATIYVQITRGAAPRNHIPSDKDLSPTTLAYIREIPPANPAAWERGTTTVTRVDDRWAHCDLKTSGLVANVMGKMEAKRRGADEVLYVGADGVVHEGGSVNVYAVIGGEVFTHPAGPKILNGVTRLAILEIGPRAGIACHEAPRTLQEYLAADEVFLSSTLRDAGAIVSIDGRTIGNGRPGPVTRRIRESLLRALAEETS